jgi:hypothetical protein
MELIVGSAIIVVKCEELYEGISYNCASLNTRQLKGIWKWRYSCKHS